jgi:hypothetical protein
MCTAGIGAALIIKEVNKVDKAKSGPAFRPLWLVTNLCVATLHQATLSFWPSALHPPLSNTTQRSAIGRSANPATVPLMRLVVAM